MAGIWIRLMKKNRIEKDISVDCLREDWRDALDEGCRKMDVARPLILPRHDRDWEEFGQTRFLPDAFMEHVAFDRLEIEFIDPDAKKKRSQDPRNA